MLAAEEVHFWPHKSSVEHLTTKRINGLANARLVKNGLRLAARSLVAKYRVIEVEAMWCYLIRYSDLHGYEDEETEQL